MDLEDPVVCFVLGVLCCIAILFGCAIYMAFFYV